VKKSLNGINKKDGGMKEINKETKEEKGTKRRPEGERNEGGEKE
jgi:hypothetical protein